MTKLTRCVVLCLGLFLAGDESKVNSLDYGHASLVVPVPDRIDANQSRQSWMDRFDAALRSLLIPETVKIINALDGKSSGHEIEAGDLEGLRLKRESENDVEMNVVSENNDEKRSAEEEKVAEVKEKTKEKTKQINDKEDKDKEVIEKKKMGEKNENAGKGQLEKRKTRQNTHTEEYDDEFDTGIRKRSKFSDFKRDSKPYRSASGVSYLEIKNEEAGTVNDEEEYELENLMRQRNFKSRLARNNEDRRSRRTMKQHEGRRKRRRHDDGKFPRRYRKEADDDHFYRRRRYYDLVNPFHVEGEDSPMMRRAYRDDAAGYDDLRQRDRRHGDSKSTFRNRRRSDEDAGANDEAMRLDDTGYDRLLRKSRNSENADSEEDVENIRSARGLKEAYDDVRELLFDDIDASSEEEQRRSVRHSEGGADEEAMAKYDDERMKRGWAAAADDDDDEMAEERRRRSQDDEESRFARRSDAGGDAEGRDADRRRRADNADQFYEQELPRGAIIKRGKRRPVWKTVQRQPFEY